MKRIQAACIAQTLVFRQKDPQAAGAAEQTRAERRAYEASLRRSGTRYQILGEQTREDGSIELKILKQYNQSPVGDYLG